MSRNYYWKNNILFHDIFAKINSAGKRHDQAKILDNGSPIDTFVLDFEKALNTR